ncbi:alpha-(1,3)-fucosyltransferase C-like [Vanessa cardui]|uniref:alpha-(1,3)-fucosyltransferase C-like n=1 Tax=Vanessa cardui TaxID=171605 RepID=UPI001F12F885|nr:alpha-(1,3)-fucosyltransferase C-like [Vanessa cardui]
MRCNLLVKPFFYLSTILMLIFLYISFYNNKQIEQESDDKLISELEKKYAEISAEDSIPEMKYILQWTSPNNIPFKYLGKGQKVFIDRHCIYNNCFVTSDRYLLGDYTKFDVIAFAGPEIVHVSRESLPDKRSPHQKFVFASLESPDYYPVCSDNLDNFFNWTWTYKVNSDERWGYMVVRNASNAVVGPNAEMHWIQWSEMDSVCDDFKAKLKTKTKAAAWFVSNCNSRSGREHFVNRLNKELKKYDLNVDIYGRCGPLKCPRDKHKECVKMLEKDYYFYLSFENSFAEDYVTEKLLTSLNNNVVPIVFGAANYTRFMPDGMYLNARELGPVKLAEKMNELILNPDLYADYFRWKNHYSYHHKSESKETDEYCRFCSMLNNKELVQEITTYPNFRQWWDPPNRC